MMNNKIDLKEKRIITKDWSSFFQGFNAYKPMHLVRRNGAFLCGILLEKHSGNIDYEPIFHIYNLMVDFPVISLGSATYLLNHNGARDRVTLLQHKEGFLNYAERLQRQIPLLQECIVSCDKLVSYLKNIVVNSSICYPVDSLRDIVLALFWCGKISEAEAEIENGKRIISQWDNGVKQRINGENGWEQQVRQLMNIDTLKLTVEMQLKKYKLESFPDFNLGC